MASDSQQQPLWQPTQAGARADGDVPLHALGGRAPRPGAVDGYDELWRWSVDELEEFWATCGSSARCARRSPTSACSARARCPAREWFPGAELNYAENLLAASAAATRPGGRRTPPSCASCNELTWGELSAQVARGRGGLRALGVERGDRVVAYMPNIPETLVAFLATASIGAIWSSAAPEFGARSVIDRFAQIEPKVLLAVDGYRYGGKDFDRTRVVAELRRELPTLEHTVVLPYLGARRLGCDGALGWDASSRAELRPPSSTFEQVPFDHPLWVLYSSGTTGLPKAIVQATAASCSSSSRSAPAPGPARRATACSGSPRPAG